MLRYDPTDTAVEIFYDASCGMCTRLAGWIGRTGAVITPLQTEGVAQRLGIAQADTLAALRAVTVDGRRLDGAEAVVAAARRVRWAWPFVTFTRLPGAMVLLDRLYRSVATRRSCAIP